MAPFPTENRSVLDRALAGKTVDEQISGDDDNTRTRLLDAAWDMFREVGLARASMDDIARKAGLSRITIYRKFNTRDELIEEVLLREFQRYFTQFRHDIAAATTVEERVVVGFVSSLHTIGNNPLLNSLLRSDPASFISFIAGDNGRLLASVRTFLAGQLRREQAVGNIPASVDPDVAAELMARLCASLLTTPSTVVDLNDHDQLADIARKYLVPMIR